MLKIAASRTRIEGADRLRKLVLPWFVFDKKGKKSTNLRWLEG